MTAPRARASGELGVALRSVLLDPQAGFEDIFSALRTRAAAGTRAPEGAAPYLLAAMGGIAGMFLWLKIGALLGFRQVAAAEFRWSYLIVAGVAGMLIAVTALVLWGYTGAGIARLAGRGCHPRDLRVVWGASGLPQLAVLLLVLPLDLLVVGPATFTSERLTDPLSTGWAALSIALSASVAVWSVYIFVRGTQVALAASWPRATMVALVGAACLAAVVTAMAWAARSVVAA